jgi:hypothetical protein
LQIEEFQELSGGNVIRSKSLAKFVYLEVQPELSFGDFIHNFQLFSNTLEHGKGA